MVYRKHKAVILCYYKRDVWYIIAKRALCHYKRKLQYIKVKGLYNIITKGVYGISKQKGNFMSFQKGLMV